MVYFYSDKILFGFLLLVMILFVYTVHISKAPFTNSFCMDGNIKNNKKSSLKVNIMCVQFVAGLGNNIFQFASAYGISRKTGHSLIIPESSRVAKIFKITTTSNIVERYCKSLPAIKEHNDLYATYDPSMVNVKKTEDIRVGSYLQSWKYFASCKDSLRKQLQFQANIKDKVNKIMRRILQNKQRSSVTLVGVHNRRGDMVNNKLGFQVATPDYFAKAVKYFENHFTDIIFVVTSNDIPWCKNNMPKNSTFVYVHNEPEIDIAVLAECDHTIMTVGTFGWWGAWLAGGNVTYYKNPAAKGSWWDKKISIVDHFPLDWIGL